MTKWIAIIVKQPEINAGEVLVTDGKKCWVASRWQIEASKLNTEPKIYFSPTICDCCDDEEFRNPTHWMPLPELPTPEKK